MVDKDYDLKSCKKCGCEEFVVPYRQSGEGEVRCKECDEMYYAGSSWR